MGVDQVVLLGRTMLEEVMILVGPILAVAIVVSLTVNIVQVLTSLQDNTVSTVTRLLVTGAALFFLMLGCGAISLTTRSACSPTFTGTCDDQHTSPLHHQCPVDHKRAPHRAHAVRPVFWKQRDSRTG